MPLQTRSERVGSSGAPEDDVLTSTSAPWGAETPFPAKAGTRRMTSLIRPGSSKWSKRLGTFQPIQETRMDSILHHAKIATNSMPSFVEAIAIKDGKITAAGTNDEILRQRGLETHVIDGKGRTV